MNSKKNKIIIYSHYIHVGLSYFKARFVKYGAPMESSSSAEGSTYVIHDAKRLKKR